MGKYIYDIETLSNCFTVTFLNIETEEVHDFVLHKIRYDEYKLIEFMTGVEQLIGFNNLDFDWPVLNHFLETRCDEKKLYKKAQSIIDSDKMNWDIPSIPQIDLMKLNHFDNKGRSASLKWLQINMGFPSVQDMPFDHSHKVKTEEIPMILKYNLNDVKATFELYKRSLSKLEMRRNLGAKYGADMTNYPDTKIGEYIVLKMLSDEMGTSISALKKCQTPRSQVAIKDCILSTVRFESPEFQKLYLKFQEMVVKKDEKVDEICVSFDGMDYYFGLGGLHACRGAEIYENLHSADVSGYYPSVLTAFKFHPAHFGSDFVEVFDTLKEERGKHAKGTDDNTAIKLAQNGVVGKAGSEYSPFYDLQFLYKITVNGQLLLAMLCERLTLRGAAQIVMANTDGIEVRMKDRALFDSICKQWEKAFGLKLEHSEYSKMVVRDINSYIAVTTTGKVKEKGFFLTEPELHQDHSSLAIQKALKKYFIEGVPVEESIPKFPIGDLLIGARARVGKFQILEVIDGNVVVKPLQKNIRYYISKRGKPLQKVSEKKKEIRAKKITLFNEWVDGPYDVDYQWYIKECYKIINLFKNEAELF